MNNAGSLCTTSLTDQVDVPTVIHQLMSATRNFVARLKTGRPTKMTEEDLNALDGLSAEILKDIGAPEWLQDRAHRAKERAHQGGMFERESTYWR